MANALFDFDLDGGDRGFEATNGQTYGLRLRQQPPIGVDSVLFQVWDEAGSNPSLGIASNPPRASKNAPALTLVGASSGAAVSPATLDGTVSIEAPASGGHSFIVRCVVNGGKRTLPNGKQVLDPSLIHERGFFTRTAGGNRKIVCTERQEFETDGFAGAVSDLMESGGGGGGESIAAGSYVGQPAQWNGSAWVPLALDETLVLPFIGSPDDLPLQLSARVGGEIGSTLKLETALVDLLSIGSVKITGGSGGIYQIDPFTGGAPQHTFLTAVGDDPFDYVSNLAMGTNATGEALTIGFLGADPVERQSVIGENDSLALSSLIAALVALGLISDDRFS